MNDLEIVGLERLVLVRGPEYNTIIGKGTRV